MIDNWLQAMKRVCQKHKWLRPLEALAWAVYQGVVSCICVGIHFAAWVKKNLPAWCAAIEEKWTAIRRCRPRRMVRRFTAGVLATCMAVSLMPAIPAKAATAGVTLPSDKAYYRMWWETTNAVDLTVSKSGCEETRMGVVGTFIGNESDFPRSDNDGITFNKTILTTKGKKYYIGEFEYPITVDWGGCIGIGTIYSKLAKTRNFEGKVYIQVKNLLTDQYEEEFVVETGKIKGQDFGYAKVNFYSEYEHYTSNGSYDKRQYLTHTPILENSNVDVGFMIIGSNDRCVPVNNFAQSLMTERGFQWLKKDFKQNGFTYPRMGDVHYGNAQIVTKESTATNLIPTTVTGVSVEDNSTKGFTLKTDDTVINNSAFRVAFDIISDTYGTKSTVISNVIYVELPQADTPARPSQATEIKSRSITIPTVNGQKYLCTTTNSAPTTSTEGWKSASSTTMTFNNLEPGKTYYFWTYTPAGVGTTDSRVSSSLSVTTTAPLSTVALTVDTPTAAVALPKAADIGVANNAAYNVSDCTWEYKTTNDWNVVRDVFKYEATHRLTATVILPDDSDLEFSASPSVTVNKNTATVERVDQHTLKVTYEFTDPTAEKPKATITLKRDGQPWNNSGATVTLRSTPNRVDHRTEQQADDSVFVSSEGEEKEVSYMIWVQQKGEAAEDTGLTVDFVPGQAAPSVEVDFVTVNFYDDQDELLKQGQDITQSVIAGMSPDEPRNTGLTAPQAGQSLRWVTKSSDGTGIVEGPFAIGTDIIYEKTDLYARWAETITAVEVNGITAPEGGATAVTEADLSVPDGSNYEVWGLTWTPELVDGKFDYNTEYTAKVDLLTSGLNAFPASGLKGTMDGKTAQAESSDGLIATVSYKYPITGTDPAMDLAAAKETVEGMEYSVPQKTVWISSGYSSYLLRRWIQTRINTELESGSTNVKVERDQDVKLSLGQSPVAGTAETPKGTNGSFTFQVTLTKGDNTVLAENLTGVITATPYVSEAETAAPSFLPSTSVYTKQDPDEDQATFGLKEDTIEGTEYYVYDAETGGNSVAVTVRANGDELTVEGDAIAEVREKTDFYISAKENNKSESSRTKITVYPAPKVQTSTLEFASGKDSYGKREADSDTATFILSEPRPEGTTYNVYTAASGDGKPEGITATGIGNTITLKGISSLEADTVYYLAATEPEKTEGQRASVTVLAYVAPSVKLGMDYTVTATIPYGGATNPVTDTIDIIFDKGTNPDYEFLLSDFTASVSGGNPPTQAVIMAIDVENGTMTIGLTEIEPNGGFILNYKGNIVGRPRINAVMGASSDATLRSLALSEGTLTPEYNAGRIAYEAAVQNRVDSITVTPAANESNAAIKVNGTSVTSGQASQAIPLNVGTNKITVEVTAHDGTTVNSYVIVVTRENPQSGQPQFVAGGNVYSKKSLTENEAAFTLTEARANTTYQVYTQETGGTPSDLITARASGTTLTLSGISSLTEETAYYVSAVENGSSESARTKVTVKPYNAPASTPVFTSNKATFTNNTDTAIRFAMTNHADGRSYALYSGIQDVSPLEKPVLTVEGNDLVLTYETAPSSGASYYVGAKESGKPDSDRVQITVNPYVAPAVSRPLSFAAGGDSFTKPSAEASTASFTLSATPVSGAQYKVYDAATGGNEVTSVSVSASNRALQLTGTAVSGITENTIWYIGVTENGKTESSRAAVTINAYKAPSDKPAFSSTSYAKESADDNTATYPLSSAPENTVYKVYGQSSGGTEVSGLTATAEGGTLTLTGIGAITSRATYYISATENGKGESTTRTAVTIEPYEAPSITMGSDTTVSVTYKESDPDTTEAEDTITALLNKGSDSSYTFAAADFTVSSSNSLKNGIDGVAVTEVRDDGLTISVKKSVTTTRGYLWYKDQNMGAITINKTVEQPVEYNVSTGTYANGSVTASPAKGAAGTQITLTINPDNGYELDSITVKKAGGNDTVTLSGSGNTRTFSMPEYDVTVEAAFKLSGDQEAVNMAKGEVEGHSYTVAQADANTSAAVKGWLVTEINALLKEGSTGVTVTDSDITMNNSFTAATTGTESTPNGRNGSFAFTVKLAKSSANAATSSINGTITATAYTAPDQSGAPEFSADTYTKTSADENQAEFTLTSAAAANTVYKVYAGESGGAALTNVVAAASGSTLTLTGIASVADETDYYISATEQNKAESTRTKVTVKPYTTEKSSAKSITEFKITGQVGSTVINQLDHTIEVTMPAGTNVTNLTPSITVSAKASVNPASDTAANFTDAVTYTVTAEDETKQTYTVTVKVQEATTEYDVTYDLTNIKEAGLPDKAESGQELEVILEAENGYSLPDTITVKMGGTTLGTEAYTYDKSTGTVTISSVTGNVEIKAAAEEVQGQSSDATLSALSYQIGNEAKKAVPEFDPSTDSYDVELPYGTSETATITLTGTTNHNQAEITTNEGVTLENGEGTATITVTAEDGSTKTYTVNFTTEATQPAFVAVTDITGVRSEGTAGENLTLEGTVEPEEATNQEITWSIESAGDTGAALNDNVLSTTAAGTVTVRATIENGKSETEEFTKDFEITIKEAVQPDYVAVTDITDVPSGGTVGEDLTLEGTVAPENATNQEIVWSIKSDTTNGAVLDGDILSVAAAGTVTVTATIENGMSETEDYTKDFEITFADASDFVAVENITGIPKTATVGKKLEIKGTVAPENATYQDIVWEITDEGGTGAYFDADNYLITEAAGELTLTATIENGLAEGEDYTQEFTIAVDATASSSDAEYVQKASEAVERGSYKIKQSAAEDPDNFVTELVNLINEILEKLFGEEVERIEASDIDNLETTVEAEAGTEEETSGTDGEFTFDVTIHKNDEEATLEGLTGTIKATPYVDEEQKEEDEQAVYDAIDAIEEVTEYEIAQKDALTKEKLERALKAKLDKKAGKAKISEIQFVGDIEYAVAGTFEDQSGTDGSFTFKASVSKGSVQDVWTDEIEGVIIAEEYKLKKPDITTVSLPDGTTGAEYHAQLNATSDTEVTWSVTSGDLPAGLEFGEDGSISGVPESAGSFSFTVSADNGSEYGTAEKTYVITINNPSGAEEHTITATANTGGTITPNGTITVADGGTQMFTIEAANRYYISDVLVDGISIGRQTSYTFANVSGDHTIDAVFERGSLGPSGGGGGGGSSSSGSTSSSTNQPSTSTSTQATADGGQVTTTQTTMTDTSGKKTTVTVETKKDAAGNVVGTTTTVTTDRVEISANEGKSIITVRPDMAAAGSAASAAGATSANPLGVLAVVPESSIIAELQKPEITGADIHVTAGGSAQNAEITGVLIGKDVIQAAKDQGKNLSVTVTDAAGNLEAVWAVDGSALAASSMQAADLGLSLRTAPVASEDPAAKTVQPLAGSGSGLVINITGDGTLTAPMRLTIPATNQTGLQADTGVTLYRYDQAANALIPVANYLIDANGNVTVDLPAQQFAGNTDTFVLLPNGQVPAAAPAVLPAPAGAGTTYEIKRGDTLYKIAREYGCSIQDLLNLNHIPDVGDLRIGQVIQLPAR